MPDANVWFSAPGKRRQGDLQLLCFHHAGGNTSFFRRWGQLLPDAIEPLYVNYPGRGTRFLEPSCTEVDSFVSDLIAASERRVREAYALFGYSLGGVLAYEFARKMTALGRPPAHLVVGAVKAPHLFETRLSDRSDEELIRKLIRCGGTQSELFDLPELLELTLATLRADMRLLDRYAFRPGPPLNCPITVLGGDQDPEASEEGLNGWRGYTTGTVNLRLYQGSHFFIQEREDEVLSDISADLGAVASPSFIKARFQPTSIELPLGSVQ